MKSQRTPYNTINTYAAHIYISKTTKKAPPKHLSAISYVRARIKNIGKGEEIRRCREGKDRCEENVDKQTKLRDRIYNTHNT